MSAYISESLKARIEQEDHQRCCYCLTSETNSGIPMTLRMNNPVIVAARYRWAINGWHPPENV